MEKNLAIEIDHDLDALLADKARVQNALKRGVRQACRINKALGVPMVVWENGQVKEIPPDQIPID